MTRQDAPPRADLGALALAAVAAARGHDDGRAGDWTPAMLADCVAALRSDPAPSDRPIVCVADALGLEDYEFLAVALCMAVERDALAAQAVALAQPECPLPRPLLHLAAEAGAPLGATVIGLACGRAVASGLLTLGEDEKPLPLRTLFAPLPMVAALAGRENDWGNVTLFEPVDLNLPESIMTEAAVRASLLANGMVTALAVRSSSRPETLAVAEAVGEALNQQLAVIDGDPPSGLGAWLAATGRTPLFVPVGGLGESWRLPRIGHYDGPVLIAMPLDGTIVSHRTHDEWSLTVPDPAERTALWLGQGVAPDDAKRAARSFRQGAGRIAEAGAAAVLAASREGRAQPRWEDVALGVASNNGALDKLARRSPARVTEDALILPPDIRAALDALAARMRVRSSLADTLGPAIRARYRPGVRALMTGEPGTGKTLAAHWLAGQIGLPLYRVDMAALTSKWIGETEKNLSAILSAAEHADALLFFDEADALFGGRTEVNSGNDRHANAQTNYLLQRIEDFDGIVLLSSNSRDRFDPAFARRLDAILHFPMPDAKARRDLWLAHVGGDNEIDEAVLDQLAVTVDLAGGHIRNIVLAAAAAALSASRPIAADDLGHALAEEYAKLGRAPPPVRR